MYPNIIDLFSGCGGISHGFKLSNYNVLLGIDFNKDAILTYKNNFKTAKTFCGDMLQLKEEDIIEILDGLSNIDVVVGGPPCQGFSCANRNNKDTEDPRNKLFYEFIRFVELINPKAVLIENVRGILTSNNGFAKEEIISSLEKLGYKTSYRVIDTSLYGIPQKRIRTFFIALKDKEFNFDWLKKSNEIVTVKDAIGELYELEHLIEKEVYNLDLIPDTSYRRYLRNEDNSIYNHKISYPSEKNQHRMTFVPQGGNWKDIPPYLFENIRDNRHSSAFKRLDENLHSITVDTGHNNYFHPIFNRVPTVRETARLQSFCDNFIFYGSKTSQFKQVGNAVPPLLIKQISEILMEVI